MLIAHISDFHIVAEPGLCYGYSNTRESLKRTISTLNVLDPRPDLILITGDLVDEPSPQAYATLADIMADLSIPFIVIPGNHDDRALLAQTFPDHDYLPQGGSLAHFTQDISVAGETMRLVALDAVVSGKEYAEILPESLLWLARALQDAPTVPTLIAMHHPPIPTGLAFMDAFQPPFRPSFAALLESNPQVRLVVCGHVHRLVDGMIGHARVASAGSTAHQFVFATDLDSVPRLSGEPAMIRLHLWRQGAVTTFTVPVDNSFERHSFGGMDNAAWESIRKNLLAGQRRITGAMIEGSSE